MTAYHGKMISWVDRSVHARNVCFGQVVYQPGGYCGPRVQRDFELVALHSGDCSVKVEDTCHELRPGVAYLFLPEKREHFRFSATGQTHHSYCSVQPDFMPSKLRLRLEKAPFSVSCSDLFQRLFSSAFLIPDTRSGSAQTLVDQLGLALFSCFLDLVERSRAETHDDPFVARVMRYMDDHFADERCLADSQAPAGCCRNLLIRKFAEKTGLTPARYLWKLRTEKGIAMLTKTGLTTAEIAYKCGFKNPFHFSRLVRLHQGASPREIRKGAPEIHSSGSTR